MASELGRLVFCLFAVCVLAGETALRVSAHFPTGLFCVFKLLSFEHFFVYSKYESFVRYVVGKYFSPSRLLAFSSSYRVFHRAKVFNIF